MEEAFKLADAQELVARQSGFESWQALKAGAQAMTDTSGRAIPAPIIFIVRDPDGNLLLFAGPAA